MYDTAQAMTKLLNKKIAEGMTAEEAAISVGFKKLTATDRYCLPCGLHQTKLLTLTIK